MTGAPTGASSATPQPGALHDAGLRQVVMVLSIVQIVSWGVLCYSFAALQSSIAADTGWSSVAVTGAFSLAQFVSGGIGIWVGRHIDDVGPRRVMTAAALVAIPGVAPSPWLRTWSFSTPAGCWPGSRWPAPCTRRRSPC